MGMAANAGAVKAGIVAGVEDFGLIHAAHRFDAFEAGGFHSLKFFMDRSFEADGFVHDALFDGALFGRRISSGGEWPWLKRCRDDNRAGRGQEASTREILRSVDHVNLVLPGVATGGTGSSTSHAILGGWRFSWELRASSQVISLPV